MAVRFIIDSASDVLPEEAKALGVVHLPLTVRFGEQDYLDSIDMSHRTFYKKLIETDVLPTTSQINPEIFENAYREVTEAGDTAIVITMSSKLSGTYQSAVIAAEDYKGKVFVVDSLNVTVGERLLLYRGLEFVRQGLSAMETVIRLNEEKTRIRVMALLDTLEYLKKGGRISAAVAFAGGVLGIKPVVAVSDGLVALVGKARGSKNGGNLLRKLVADCGGINFDKPFALAYSGLSDELLQKYIEDSADLWKHAATALPIHTVGCAIGTHVGPGAVAVAFFENDR